MYIWNICIELLSCCSCLNSAYQFVNSTINNCPPIWPICSLCLCHCLLKCSCLCCCSISFLPACLLQQLPSYWQMVASVKRFTSRRCLCSAACRVFTPPHEPAAVLQPLGHTHEHSSLLCLPLDNCAADCPHFRLEIILKTFTQLNAVCLPI